MNTHTDSVETRSDDLIDLGSVMVETKGSQIVGEDGEQPQKLFPAAMLSD